MDDQQLIPPQAPPQMPRDAPVAPPPPVPPPVSPKLKEQGPIDWSPADKVAKEEGDDYWENFSREIELEKEIAEMGGVEKVESGEVKIPQKLAAEMGIKPTVTEQTPIAAATGFSIRGVSLSDDQIGTGLTKPTSSGLRWLVEWFIYQLLKAHYFVKKIKGKIIRQKK